MSHIASVPVDLPGKRFVHIRTTPEYAKIINLLPWYCYSIAHCSLTYCNIIVFRKLIICECLSLARLDSGMQL